MEEFKEYKEYKEFKEFRSSRRTWHGRSDHQPLSFANSNGRDELLLIRLFSRRKPGNADEHGAHPCRRCARPPKGVPDERELVATANRQW